MQKIRYIMLGMSMRHDLPGVMPMIAMPIYPSDPDLDVGCARAMEVIRVPLVKQKVIAYITHKDRLLVFRHPDAPDAGVQVPAGTLRAGEPPDEGVMREALEETGLPALTLVRVLGEYVWDLASLGRDERHHRYVYHLRCEGEPPFTWRHEERDPSDGSVAPIVFEFSWARLPDEIPLLSGDQGRFLPQLLESLPATA